MIKINATGKLHTNGVPINEPVYVRTSQDCGVGNSVTQTDENGNEIKFIEYYISAAAWLSSKYDEINPDTGLPYKTDAPTVPVDEFADDVYILVPEQLDITPYQVFGNMYKVFNQYYADILVQNGVILDTEYEIL